ncbi:hypothetical protein HD806DRAFT_548648 [Xylariaceae sp. AK1471]|nr:hypothetical protein HD806DRAFT_548648 [Xylariaceae sp. AK1471]
MWSPFYLQRWVLITFTIIFILLIAIIETLLAISNRYNGLYGPTAVLTLTALMWDRVTFQAQMLAPWYRMQRSKSSADRGLLLDYLDMLPPMAIISALRRRDWAPAAALSVYLVLQALIESAVLTELGTRFHDISTYDMIREAPLAYLTMGGLSDFQFPYPKGTNAEYAYQTPSRPGIFGTSLQMSVDGFFATLDCNNATLERHRFDYAPESDKFGFNTTFEIREGNCSMEVNSYLKTGVPKNITSLSFVRVFGGSCSNDAIPNRNRTAIVIGKMGYSIGNPDEVNMTKYEVSGLHMISSTQVICVPTYNFQTLTLTQNGTSVSVGDASPGQVSNPFNSTSAYRFMRAQLNAISYGESVGGIQAEEHVLQNSSAVTLDYYATMVRLSELSQVPDSSLLDPSLWLTAIPRYFRKFSAQIAKTSLLEPAMHLNVTATRRQNEDRLIVLQPICHTMAALLGFCALGPILFIFFIPRYTSLQINPASIRGTAEMAREETSLVLRLRDQGLGRSHSIQHRLHGAVYKLVQLERDNFRLIADHQFLHTGPHCSRRPDKPRRYGKYVLALHPISRFWFVLSLGGSIAALEVLLRQSQRNHGLGPADRSFYVQYSWTLVPPIFLTLMSMIAGSMDTATRSLVPLLNLKNGGSFEKTIDLDFLDGSITRMLFKGVQLRSWTVVFAIAAFSTSSLFTIFSDSLFETQHVQIIFNTKLRVNTTVSAYGNLAGMLYGGASMYLHGAQVVASTSILASNGSFPPFTFKDLVFPSLLLDDMSMTSIDQSNTSNTATISILANVPAVRSRLLCRTYSGDQIRTNLTMGRVAAGIDPYTFGGTFRVPNPLRLDIDNENCKLNKSIELRASTIMIPMLQENVKEGVMTFGVSSGAGYGDFTYGGGWVGGCGMILYAWGRAAVHADGISAIDAFALGCNETIETVNAEVYFNGTDLTVDSNHPPVVDESSARPADIQLNYFHDNCYFGMNGLIDLAPSHFLDEFFVLLTTSPWALPVSDLVNASALDKVVNAIQAQHGLIRAEALAGWYRVFPNESSRDAAPQGTPDLQAAFYNANATILPGRLRVVQDLQSTRVLQGLLAATLAFSVLAWCLTPRSNIIIGSPTSIVRRIALLAGGNIFEDVWPYPTDVAPRSEGRIFVIGWRVPPRASNERPRFGIWSLTPEEVEKWKQELRKKRGV